MATLDVQNKHIGTERRLSNVSYLHHHSSITESMMFNNGKSFQISLNSLEDPKRGSLSNAIAQSSLFQHFKEIVKQIFSPGQTP